MINLKNAKIVKGDEVVNSLLYGKVITLNDSSALWEPRLYRFNSIKKSMEYSDDNIHWKKSNANIDEMTGEYLIVE